LLYESRYLKNIKFIKGDIRDINLLSQIVNNYDCIIWLAALVGDGACAINPELTTEINYKTVKWLVNNYNGKIVFTSTCSIYGINHDIIEEDAKPNPLSVYAKTKLEAEQYIINNYDNYLIFRLGTLFGLGDEHSRIRLDLVANVLTMKAILGEKLSVFGGEQWRPLLHVKDVSTAILYSLENNIKGLYNLSYQNYTIKNIAETIKTIVPNADIVYTELNFEDLRNYKVKNDKFLKTGWCPKHSLREGIVEIKNLFNQNRIVNPKDVIYSNADYLKKNINE
jgi:nucleoside-diphosphate-sugar epimerase